jgi:hypothetical protein
MRLKYSFLCLFVFITIFSVGCGPRQTVVNNLGNAENSLFTNDGRLFITGKNIWEIKQKESGHYADSLADDLNCDFTGMAQYNNHLFAICFEDEQGDAWLLRAELTASPEFEKIFQLTDMTVANGMGIDDQGHLYIADETLFQNKGKIIRLSLTDAPVPQVVESSRRVWLSAEEGAQAPNGITIVDNKLFFTNMDISDPQGIRNSIKRVPIEGDQPGPVETVFSRVALKNSSIFDDLTSTDILGQTYLIVTDYLKGSILTVAADGTDQEAPIYETKADKFAGPTSCILGQGLGFDEEDLLVTEGGIVLIDPNSNFGNRLSVVRYQPEF